MSLYGKITGTVLSIAIVGCGAYAAYGAKAGADTISDARVTLHNIKYYVLKEYSGSVALFEDGLEAPIAVYSTPLSQINAADAELIKEGIRLRGMNEVSRLLEDLDIE